MAFDPTYTLYQRGLPLGHKIDLGTPDQLWRGGVMATLDMFWLIHTTSVLSNADTEDKAFTLILREAFPNPDFQLFLQFPKPS